MSRLLGVEKKQVIQDPVGALKKAVDLTHSTVLLKGASTLILSPDEVMHVNHFPNSGMATAGSGDVLAGMIGALLGQGQPELHAALLGVYLHSQAGALAAKAVHAVGMRASDIITHIPFALKNLSLESQKPHEARMAKLL